MEVYERIKERRKELDLSANDVADALGVSRATVYRYESAAIEKLPTTVLQPLAQVLRCSPAYLMGWTTNVSGDAPEQDASTSETCFTLSDLEKQIISRFRSLSPVERNMILRSLGLEEEARGECAEQNTA